MYGVNCHARIAIGCTFVAHFFCMKKIWLSIAFSAIHLITWAQCAVCTKTAASIDDSAARGLNGGIIYLAFMRMTLILFIGYRWYKSNKAN